MDNILLADTNARKAKRRSRRFIEKHDKNIIEEDRALARSFSDLSYKTSPYVTITLRVAESIVEKSLIYIRQRKFVKGIEE